MGSLDDDLEEDEESEDDLESDTEEYEDIEDLKSRSGRIDNVFDDMMSFGMGIPIYQTVLRDRKGNEYIGLGGSKHDSYESALEKYRSER